ncbi:MAG: PrsW family glutamic-type intramembrane protease [Solobacterium sp.]|jgi:RsiW-degrading membrane proteinase PrsW (M82 family)|nr:PrsW family glutamic-type intramembrane protease [Solobacterium sp.]MCH4205440.1 PrsW family glutamic-type intramembrane protease [Solobacterium sp.]MCH4226652.1 PrsW family glutamic-type intramembrane protease [Solobacterium sp.]MCH4282127.1 PrsW family glutamic-type intramembrane protease [Solobacterium sp.]
MFISAAMSTIAIYLAAAVLPAVFLLRYIYRLDAAEKEPPELLVKLIFGGLGAAVCALILEEVFDWLIGIAGGSSDELISVLIEAGSVAVIEESMKYIFLKRISWNHPAFNYRFDGMVYAIFVSLGFAILENILYVFFNGGLYVALTRAVLSIPAHMCFAAYMGIYYGRAKVCEHAHDPSGVRWNLAAGLLMAILFHMIYDGTLMFDTGTSLLLFIAVVAFMYLYVFHRIKREAAQDESID